MKKLIVILVIFLSTFFSIAQPPSAFRYQAVVRDSTGAILPNQNVSFQFSIVTSEIGGETLYVETHDTLTNQFGLVSLHLGLGNVVFGGFDDLPWGEIALYLQVEIDVNGKKDFTKMNKAQLIGAITSNAAITKTILVDDNGFRWRLKVDTQGNLYTVPLVTWYCGNSITDSRDGQVYSTIMIGAQCWMTENLNIGMRVNGSNNQFDNDTIEKYCYANDTNNCNAYGGLYEWDEMMGYVSIPGSQGICPDGWHIPTDPEWCTLENEVNTGNVSCNSTGWRGTDAGDHLKETGTMHWDPPNAGATNSSGFTARGGGFSTLSSSFYDLKIHGNFWTSSSSGGMSAWCRRLSNVSSEIHREDFSKILGYSVRCIKD